MVGAGTIGLVGGWVVGRGRAKRLARSGRGLHKKDIYAHGGAGQQEVRAAMAAGQQEAEGRGSLDCVSACLSVWRERASGSVSLKRVVEVSQGPRNGRACQERGVLVMGSGAQASWLRRNGRGNANAVSQRPRRPGGVPTRPRATELGAGLLSFYEWAQAAAGCRTSLAAGGRTRRQAGGATRAAGRGASQRQREEGVPQRLCGGDAVLRLVLQHAAHEVCRQ